MKKSIFILCLVLCGCHKSEQPISEKEAIELISKVFPKDSSSTFFVKWESLKTWQTRFPAGFTCTEGVDQVSDMEKLRPGHKDHGTCITMNWKREPNIYFQAWKDVTGLKPNSNYTWKAWIKNDETNYHIFMTSDPTWNNRFMCVSDDTYWNEYKTTVKTDAKGTMALFMIMEIPGKVWVSDISLTEEKK